MLSLKLKVARYEESEFCRVKTGLTQQNSAVPFSNIISLSLSRSYHLSCVDELPAALACLHSSHSPLYRLTVYSGAAAAQNAKRTCICYLCTVIKSALDHSESPNVRRGRRKWRRPVFIDSSAESSERSLV